MKMVRLGYFARKSVVAELREGIDVQTSVFSHDSANTVQLRGTLSGEVGGERDMYMD